MVSPDKPKAETFPIETRGANIPLLVDVTSNMALALGDPFLYQHYRFAHW
ncbi:MAG: hypothetical protein R2739_11190 [Chitinophagales bacterium]